MSSKYILRKVPYVRYFGYTFCIFCTPVDVVVSNVVNVGRMLKNVPYVWYVWLVYQYIYTHEYKYHTSGILGTIFELCGLSLELSEALSSICLLESSSKLLFQQSKEDFITLRICLTMPLHLWHASLPIFVVGCAGHGTILGV